MDDACLLHILLSREPRSGDPSQRRVINGPPHSGPSAGNQTGLSTWPAHRPHHPHQEVQLDPTLTYWSTQEGDPTIRATQRRSTAKHAANASHRVAFAARLLGGLLLLIALF